jgi:hypothetical protein
MPSSGMWRCVYLVWTDVSEERIASIFRVKKSASEEPTWTCGSETSVHTRSTWRHTPEDDILEIMILFVTPGDLSGYKCHVSLFSLFHNAVSAENVYCRWIWSNWWNKNWHWKLKYYKKSSQNATLSTTNSTWPDLGSNVRRRLGKPAINRLSCGTANAV